MVHLDSCPLCSGEIRPAFTCTDYFVSGESFPVCRCANCGFTFTQDHPSERESGKYYESEEYISHSDSSKGILNKVYRFSRGIMLRKKAGLVKRMTGRTTGSLLDIGSGTGYFTNAMKTEGWNVTGIEINEKARRYAKTSFGIDTLSPAEAEALDNESFDCITLWHVLEHFSDPFGYMQLISRLLKPSGTLIIALPNSSSFDAVHYREYWAAWDVPRHLWHFTTDTFELFCSKTGFKLKETKVLPLDVFYISILSERYKKTSLPFIRGMLLGGLYWLFSLLNKRKASSIVYVIKKV